MNTLGLPRNLRNRRAWLRRGFSLVEILVALLVVAALAAGTIYLVSNVNQNAVDAKKAETAQKMNDLAVTLWQAGVSFDAVGSTADAIALLKTDYAIKSQVPGGADIHVHLEPPYPNPVAYNFVASNPATNAGPRFTPILGVSAQPAFSSY